MSNNVYTTHYMTTKGPSFHIGRSRYGWSLSVEDARNFARELLEWADAHEGFEPIRCGVKTKKGTPCQNIVAGDGVKCGLHAEPLSQVIPLPELVSARQQRDALESIEEALAAQADLNLRPSEVAARRAL